MLAAAPGARASALFGFNDGWSAAEVARTVPLARELGANTARIAVYWGSYVPRPGVYRWSEPDAAYQAMVAQGMRPLLDVVSAPAWAAARGCGDADRCQQSAAHDGAFAAFIRLMVARYPQAVGVEIGNEPNLTNWSMQPDPARYAQILRTGYRAVKQVDPSMPVITAGMCCTTINSNGNIGASRFLARLYASGISGYHDYIGVHLYPGGPVGRVALDIQSEMNAMRAVRDAAGDGAGFWVTETGFPSAGVSRYGGGTFDEPNQAQRESVAYRTVTAMPDVKALLFYRLTDPAPVVAIGSNMGFFRYDLTPKPSVQALRSAISSPALPQSTLSERAPATVRAGRSFRVSAAGRRRGIAGRAAIRYQWLVWRTDHWSAPLATTTRPVASLRLSGPGSYRLAVSMRIGSGGYMSSAATVTVLSRGHQRRSRGPFARASRSSAPLRAQIGVYPGTTVDVGSAGEFSAAGSSGSFTKESWSFGDGGQASSAGQNVNHSYLRAGAYTARLTLTDRRGRRSQASVSVNARVREPPAAQLSADNTTIRPGDTVNFGAGASSDPRGDVVAYEWDLGGSGFASGDDSASHTYSTPGTYSARVRVTDDGGLQSIATRTVTVLAYPGPVAKISCRWSEIRAFSLLRCSSDDSASPYGITTYHWDMGENGAQSSAGSVAYAYRNPGLHTVTLTVTDVHGNAASATAPIRVDDVPPVARITPPPDASFALGAPIPFDGSASFDRAGQVTRYQWDDGQGAGFQAGGSSFAPTYTQGGFHTVRLRVTNDQGQSSTTSYGFFIW